MNNLKEIKEIAEAFLYLDIEESSIPGLIIHPFFESAYVMVDGIGLVNITESEGNLQLAREKIQRIIEKAESVRGIVSMIRKPDRLTFLKYIKEYLDNATFSELLGWIYVSTENPNADVNVSVSELEKWFQNADKKELMSEEEFKMYENLPELLTVYRGVGTGRVRDGLSWTKDINMAIWFANRFNEKKGKTGYVLSAEIHKEDILAYFSKEDEIVCRPGKRLIKQINA